MIDQTQILWTPAGQNLPSLGTKALVDVSDGDTPNIRMPIRMLSIDTPEVTARSVSGAEKVNDKFAQLALWIKDGSAPITKKLGEHLLPKLESGNAGSLQFTQGKDASAFYKQIIEKRLTRPNSTKKRKLFVERSRRAAKNRHPL